MAVNNYSNNRQVGTTAVVPALPYNVLNNVLSPKRPVSSYVPTPKHTGLNYQHVGLSYDHTGLNTKHVDPNYRYNTDNNNYDTNWWTRYVIDPRYLANPKNSLTYNSMADVLLNVEAWKRRWGNSKYSWLVDPKYGGWAYNARILFDTLLLTWDQTLKPIIQNTKEHGLRGFGKGVGTAAFNGLINLGNTLDILSNPIKGLVLDGPQGFIRGSLGDKNGRKQYDYNDYIHTGSGTVDFITSLLLEIASDPVNWVTFGTKAMAAGAADSATNAITDSMTTGLNSLRKPIIEVIESGKNSVDDVVEVILKQADNVAMPMDKKLATELATKMLDGGTTITRGAMHKTINKTINSLDDSFKSQLSAMIKRGAKATDFKNITDQYTKLGIDLMQSKSTRSGVFKILDKFDPITRATKNISPAQQKILSTVLTNMNRFDSQLPKTLTAVHKLRRGANFVETTLRKIAGVTGLDELMWTHKGVTKLKKIYNTYINNKYQDGIIKYVSDFATEFKFEATDLVEKASSTSIASAEISKSSANILSKLYEAKDVFTNKLLQVDPELLTKKYVRDAQNEFITTMNSIIKNDTSLIDIKNLDEFIDTLSNTSDPILLDFAEQANVLVRIAHSDLNNRNVMYQIKQATHSFKEMINTCFDLTQSYAITQDAKDLAAFRKLQHAAKMTAKSIDDEANAIANIIGDVKFHEAVDTVERTLRSGRDIVESLSHSPANGDVYALDNVLKNLQDAIYRYNEDPALLNNQRELISAYTAATNVLQRYNKLELDLGDTLTFKNKFGYNRRFNADRDKLKFANVTIEPAKGMWDTGHMAPIKIHNIPAIGSTGLSASELYHIIDDLPTYTIPKVTGLDPVDYIKFQLTTYTITHRKATVLNEMCGIGIADNAVKYETHITKAHVPKDGYERLADDLNIKYIKVGDVADKNNPFPHILKVEADNAITKLSDVYTNTTDELVQRECLWRISILQEFADEDTAVKAFNKYFQTVTETVKTPIPTTQPAMARILSEYSDTNSALYKALTDTTRYSDIVYQTDILPVKETLDRLLSYKKLTESIIQLAQRAGLDDKYTTALVDQLVTQLCSKRVITSYNLEEVIDDIMAGTDIFLRAQMGAPSVALESLLEQVANDIPDNPIVKAIVTDLSSGNAHNATTDVLNWIRLINVADDVTNPELKKVLNGVKNNLLSAAKGRKIIVFDLETIGSVEKTAKPFQIAAHVLNPDGTDSGIAPLNIIIKPKTGEKPLPTVLNKLANGADPDQWWLDNIVNAVPSDTQKVFEDVNEAIAFFKTYCDNTGAYILAGHNIKQFDIDKMLMKYNNTFNPDYFDTLEYFNLRTVYQLQGDQRTAFANQLRMLLQTELDKNNTALTQQLFSYNDIRALSQFKKSSVFKYDDMYSDGYDLTTDGYDLTTDSFKDIEHKLIESDVDNLEAEIKRLGGYTITETPDVFNVDAAIDEVRSLWISPKKLQGKHYFTVTKLDPNSFELTVKEYLKTLAAGGYITDKGVLHTLALDVTPGHNIMQYFNKHVAMDKLLYNPKIVMSYEVADIFDVQKILKEHCILNGSSNEIPVYIMQRLTNASRKIKNWRINLSEEMVNTLYDESVAFLKQVEKYSADVRCLYSEADHLSTVAAACYYYGLLRNQEKLPTEILEQFNRLSNPYAVIEQYKTSSILHSHFEKDPLTQRPRFIYEDDAFDYVKLLPDHNPVDQIKAYNVEHNLYSAKTAAIHKLHADHLEVAKRADKYINVSDEAVKSKRIKFVKDWNARYAQEDVHHILYRDNRVQALKAEARVRGGLVVFKSDTKLDLTDFANDADLLVKSNVVINDSEYLNVILMKPDLLERADKEFTLPSVILKDTYMKDADQTLIDLCVENRKQQAGMLQNLGLSRGDVASKDLFENTYEALIDMGIITEDELATVVDVKYLTSIGYFNALNANNSVIGDYSLFKNLFGENAMYISDPFRQTYKVSTGALMAQRTELIGYCNLIYNEYNSINADIFSHLEPRAAIKLFNDNPEVGAYIIRQSRHKGKFYSDVTKTGMVLEEFYIHDMKSLELAKKLNVHILPRTQAAQMMKAINTFELPPIAKFFKAISDTYKIAYLSSIGMLIRNFVDSNYKTRWALEGQVSIPEQLSSLFASMKLIKKHTEIGQAYTEVFGKYFKTDADYVMFYNLVKNINITDDEKLLAKVLENVPELNKTIVARKLKHIIPKLDRNVLRRVQDSLIDPNMFAIVDAFMNHGPSAGLAKSIINNLPNATAKDASAGAMNKFNKWLIEDSPARFVFGLNDMIEQSARLSMFLKSMELGNTLDDTITKIIKTHFDYSDKSLGMLYTEIVFPFMSFSYKNLDYWINTVYKNPMMVGELENIFRSIMNYQSLFNAEQEEYKDFDYTFDWSKDVLSFTHNAPWEKINASRLYHILSGNIMLDTNRIVKHNNGYGEKDAKLYKVFKLSPSMLDAVQMLYRPLNTYEERMLPPYEVLYNLFTNPKESFSEQFNISTLASNLPYLDTITQRAGFDTNTFNWKANNIIGRVQDLGPSAMLASLIGASYVNQTNWHPLYNPNGSVIKQPRVLKTKSYKPKKPTNHYNNQYQSYYDPYGIYVPRIVTYRNTQQSRNNPVIARNKYNDNRNKQLYDYQYNNLISNKSDAILKYRLRDNIHYY